MRRWRDLLSTIEYDGAQISDAGSIPRPRAKFHLRCLHPVSTSLPFHYHTDQRRQAVTNYHHLSFVPCCSATKDAVIVINSLWGSNSVTRRIHSMGLIWSSTKLARIFAMESISLKYRKPSLAYIDPKRRNYPNIFASQSISRLQKLHNAKYLFLSIKLSNLRTHRIGTQADLIAPIRTKEKYGEKTPRQKSGGWI